MNKLTREEMACFRTALALVLVRKRLQHKKKNRQHQCRQTNDMMTTTVTTRSNPLKRQESLQEPLAATKRLRTMESSFDEGAKHGNDDDDDATMTTCDRRHQMKSKQQEHLDGMMATAIRTASCLVGDQKTKKISNHGQSPATLASSFPQEQKAAWSTLQALTTHLAQQLSFAFSSTTAKNNQWVDDWARRSLCQLLWVEEEHSSMDAAFLVWRGILFGGSSQLFTTTPKAPRHEQQHRICRQLFLRVFCGLLQDELGVAGDLLSRDGVWMPPWDPTTSVAGTSSPPSTDASSAQGSFQSGGSATKPAWQRLFDEISKNQHVHQSPLMAVNQSWLVHGLQLVQKIAKEDRHHSSRRTRSVQPTAYLPPANLVSWYPVSTARRENVQGDGASVASSSSSSMAPAAALGPGAQLMSMVALYQALKEDK
ncbi:expressed unknown protein [Seminavis robusta]|uniref:Uncharacterized protein n=1 Tax=Seminavis robusta TaxID=568900 RepID=A0A9N8DSH0_9STRA|nr:expressed unknown protein [Seminavis robusta]|eukprot:Sro249_g098730.1 n/a (426) ;mRNA; r:50729-52006